MARDLAFVLKLSRLLQLTVGPGKCLDVFVLTLILRAIFGLGVWGWYPISFALAREFPHAWRGAMITLIFTFQGLGALVAGVTAIICVNFISEPAQTNISNEDGRLSLDISWRTACGLGLSLEFIVVSLTWLKILPDVARANKIDQTQISEPIIVNNNGIIIEITDYDMPRASLKDFRRHFGLRKNWKVLLGTAGSCLLLSLNFVSPSKIMN